MVDFLVDPRILYEIVETNHKFLSNKYKIKNLKVNSEKKNNTV